MTIRPAFDPARSAAIRELLIQTVDAGAERRAPSRFAIVAVLTALALALAGGTAALALSGVIHLGSPEPGPVAPSVVAPTSTSTPAPTSTPTSSAPRAIAVQARPIARHDVSTRPAAPSWSLDLPGSADGCTQHRVYDIADGLALFQVGAEVVGDNGDGCSRTQHVSLSLVDTAAGTVLWSREWKWGAPPVLDVDVQVLGTSGRVVVVDEGLTGGPHEVLDLSTGDTIGDFQAAIIEKGIDVVAVPGDSGDVIMTTANGIVRVDPRDAAHPRWSTTIDATAVSVFPMQSEPRFLPVAYIPTTPVAPGAGPYLDGVVDVDTGALTTDDVPRDFLAAQGATVALSDFEDYADPRTLTGLDASGRPIWTRSNERGTSVNEVLSVALSASGREATNAGTGLLALTSVHTLTLVDGSTGATRWTGDTTRCGYEQSQGATAPIVTPYLDEAHDELVLVSDGETCTFSASTGAPHPLPDVPNPTWLLLGPDNTYARDNAFAGTVRAYDRETGTELWSAASSDNTFVSFAGGYLVSWSGVHLESAD